MVVQKAERPVSEVVQHHLFRLMDLYSLHIRPLTREELDIAVEWAASEGWNPGLNDADVFWETDPEGFVGVELNGELIASGSIVSYNGQYGFMGFFIVKPELRSQGIGTKLWFHRRDLLRSRLNPDAAIGMDGVFDMQDWYAKGGFNFSHRNLRMQGKAQPGLMADQVVPIPDIPFDHLREYDEKRFGFDRATFTRAWVNMPDSTAFAYVEENYIQGYGLIRRCREGYKIGPLFAEHAEAAEALFQALSSQVVGKPINLDVPEINAAAMGLAERHGLTEVFGCARMYHGKAPRIDWNKIFGVTTFELG